MLFFDILFFLILVQDVICYIKFYSVFLKTYNPSKGVKNNFQVIFNSITNLAITWDVFTWSKQAHNRRFNYFFVHLFIIIMHHAFKLFDESLFKYLLSDVSCFKIKGSKFWEPHCILILSQYLMKKSSIYYWIFALFVIWFRSLLFSKLMIP